VDIKKERGRILCEWILSVAVENLKKMIFTNCSGPGSLYHGLYTGRQDFDGPEKKNR